MDLSSFFYLFESNFPLLRYRIVNRAEDEIGYVEGDFYNGSATPSYTAKISSDVFQAIDTAIDDLINLKQADNNIGFIQMVSPDTWKFDLLGFSGYIFRINYLSSYWFTIGFGVGLKPFFGGIPNRFNLRRALSSLIPFFGKPSLINDKIVISDIDCSQQLAYFLVTSFFRCCVIRDDASF